MEQVIDASNDAFNGILDCSNTSDDGIGVYANSDDEEITLATNMAKDIRDKMFCHISDRAINFACWSNIYFC